MRHRSNKSYSGTGKICIVLNISLLFLILCVWQYVAMEHDLPISPYHFTEYVISLLPMSSYILNIRSDYYFLLENIIFGSFLYPRMNYFFGKMCLVAGLFVIEFMVYVGIFYGIFRLFYYIFRKICKTKTTKDNFLNHDIV